VSGNHDSEAVAEAAYAAQLDQGADTVAMLLLRRRRRRRSPASGRREREREREREGIILESFRGKNVAATVRFCSLAAWLR
jgi:hypothetical protein